MAIDDAERSDAGQFDGTRSSTEERAVVGEYGWRDFVAEFGDDEDAERFDRVADEDDPLSALDWERVGVDPGEVLGFDPTSVESEVGDAGVAGARLYAAMDGAHDFEETPVRKGIYTWEDYKAEYYYDEEGDPPTDDDGEVVPFSKAEALGFDPSLLDHLFANGGQRATELLDLEDERTVNVNEDLDEDAFFSTSFGTTTVTNRYDLEKAVPMTKKGHFFEEDRYWVNKPYSFVIIFHSRKENEKKYYVIQPHRTEIESELTEFLEGKLRTSIKYSDDEVVTSDEETKRGVIEEETLELLERYDLYATQSGSDFAGALADKLDVSDDDAGLTARLLRMFGWEPVESTADELRGIAARPEPAVLEDDSRTLTEYQVEKLLYYLKRDFIGYERIDGIKHDINVEDISCDGYDSPVFVYHSDYEQIISNIYHGEEELDDFVVKLAQRSGKGISKRRPQVDATLPDGSRAQLTLGREVSDHGTNYTIRQFKDVPFTPIDLINWNTFSLDEMAYLWLCIENHKSLIFAGGTASGKTTSLNAVSLFIPSNSKIVSIEDTREVELPQRNWIASVTRPSFSDDEKGDVDEFDLLEAALRQRPDYIVMGEIRGEEGRTLFQVMSTGHTTYTTFHADSVGEVLKRFTTDPINVSKTMFTALDLVSIQSSTRVHGHKVRRNKSLTEINHYDAENDEINVQDVYQWQAETDTFLKMGDSNTLEQIKFDRGWDQAHLDEEIFKRRTVLAYLIDRGLNTYTQVAATFQAFINDEETILALMANDRLERSLEDLREMESVLIDIESEKEEMVPRPEPDEDIESETQEILDRAERELFPDYRDEDLGSVAEALTDVELADDVVAEPDDESDDDTDAGGDVVVPDDDFDVGDTGVPGGVGVDADATLGPDDVRFDRAPDSSPGVEIDEVSFGASSEEGTDSVDDDGDEGSESDGDDGRDTAGREPDDGDEGSESDEGEGAGEEMDAWGFGHVEDADEDGDGEGDE
jgi:flagellar protein FlaI